MVELQNEDERDLWKRVYVATIPVRAQAVENADQAVDDYRKRLPSKPKNEAE